MIFKKLFLNIFFLSTILFMNLNVMSSIFSLEFKNFSPMNEFSWNFNFNFCLENQALFFIWMVSLVMSMVCFYSEFYMTLYNLKKFFYLMMFFFFIMIIISMSGSFLILSTGWDGLGISSIGLIMFYPNKIGMFNSILTMFYNRLGDVLIMMCMGFFLFDPSSTFFFMEEMILMKMLVILLLCSLTKSAQFPVASWLPAAMSAPTPISAMVHSSTLVTAGIYMLSMILPSIFICNFFLFMIFVSIISFILGGFMASMEVDYKKLIAFSTMSQISMIIIFLFLCGILISMMHMIFHAIFKTLLFCAAGVVFGYSFGDQLKSQSKTSSNFLSTMIFTSASSMMGFLFSSSYFSKDMVLEVLCGEAFTLTLVMIVMGGMFTIFYSAKILFSLNFQIFNFSSFEDANFKQSFLMFFCFCCLFMGNSLSEIFFTNEPLITLEDFGLINFFLMMIMILKHRNYLNLPNFYTDVSFLKSSIYERFLDNLMLGKNIYQIFYSDKLIFKPQNMMTFKMNYKILNFLNFYSLTMVLILIF